MDLFSRVIDLTHALNDKVPNWEGSAQSPYSAKELGNMERDGYFSRVLTLPEHFGTHLDAPAHFCATGWTVEQIPAERLVGPLVLLDARKQSASNADYEISTQDISTWEKTFGRIPAGAIVLANTGWAARWPSARFRNADAKGTKHYPGYARGAVSWLVEQRSICGIGIDTMGVDYGVSEDHPNHRYTGAHNVYHLENVANVEQVPPAGALLIAAPAKLEGGSGGPVRIFALVR